MRLGPVRRSRGVTVLVVLWCCACAQSAAESANPHATFTVATCESGNLPFVEPYPRAFHGLQVDLAKRIATKMGAPSKNILVSPVKADTARLLSDMRNGIYHVYACGETIDYSNSSDDLSFSTPFLVDSIRVIIREESSQQRDSIMDIIRLLLPASAFGVLCYTSIVAVSSFWTFLIITPHSSRLHRRFDLLSAVPSPNTESPIGVSTIPVVVFWLLATCLAAFVMASYSAHMVDLFWHSRLALLEDLIDGRVGVLSGSVASHMLHNLVPGARGQNFATVSDMIAALQSRQVDAILHYEWDVRFALGTKQSRDLKPHGLHVLNYAFLERYYAFRVWTHWTNRSHFNQALMHVLDGTGEYGNWLGSLGVFRANWTAQIRDTYELEEARQARDLAEDYNHWSYMFFVVCEVMVACVLMVLGCALLLGMDVHSAEVSGLLYVLDSGVDPNEARKENWKEHLFMLHHDDLLTSFLWPTEEDIPRTDLHTPRIRSNGPKSNEKEDEKVGSNGQTEVSERTRIHSKDLQRQELDTRELRTRKRTAADSKKADAEGHQEETDAAPREANKDGEEKKGDIEKDDVLEEDLKRIEKKVGRIKYCRFCERRRFADFADGLFMGFIDPHDPLRLTTICLAAQSSHAIERWLTILSQRRKRYKAESQVDIGSLSWVEQESARRPAEGSRFFRMPSWMSVKKKKMEDTTADQHAARLDQMRQQLQEMRQMFLEELHEHAAPRFFKPDQATRGGGRVTMGPVPTPRSPAVLDMTETNRKQMLSKILSEKDTFTSREIDGGEDEDEGDWGRADGATRATSRARKDMNQDAKTQHFFQKRNPGRKIGVEVTGSTEDGVRALQNDSIGFYLDVGDSDNADEPLSGISQEQAILHVSKLMQIQLAKRDELIQNLREELAAYRIADQAVDTRTRNENKIKIYDSERSILPLSPPGARPACSLPPKQSATSTDNPPKVEMVDKETQVNNDILEEVSAFLYKEGHMDQELHTRSVIFATQGGTTIF